MSVDAATFMTLPQVAEYFGVGVGRVMTWIVNGELQATNVSASTSSRKPQYRVRREALQQFEQLRAKRPSSTRRQRRPAVRPYKEFF